MFHEPKPERMHSYEWLGMEDGVDGDQEGNEEGRLNYGTWMCCH